jgi:hypothetical protein
MDRAPPAAHMLNSLLFDPRLRQAMWIVGTLVLIVLSACQYNSGGGGGGGGGSGY